MQYTSLAADRGGEVVAAGGVLWFVQTSWQFDELAGPEDPMFSLAFSPAGNLVASGSWDGTVSMWTGFGRSGLVRLFILGGDVPAFAFRRDGKEPAVMAPNVAWSRAGTANDVQEGVALSSSLYLRTSYWIGQRSSMTRGSSTMLACALMSSTTPRNVRTTSATAGRTLPGATREDLSERRCRPAARMTCVPFALTGTAWAWASPEGLLLYTLDGDADAFEPMALDIKLISQVVLGTISRDEHLTVLVGTLRLDE